MKRIRPVQQHGSTDCGAACLAFIFQYFDSRVSPGYIRQLAGTDRQGTTIFGLVKAAESFGLQAKAAKGNADTLSLIPVPAIVHVVLPSGLHHYQVLVKIGRKKLRIMDPAEGCFHQVRVDEFLINWSGVFIMFSPMENFKAVQKETSVILRFMQLAKPHWKDLNLAFLGSLIFTVLGFSTAIFVQKLVDDVVDQNNLQLLNVLSGFMIVIICMQTILGISRNIIGFRTGLAIDARLITWYYRRLFNLPLKFFDSMRIGEIVSRINDTVKIRQFINDTALGIMINLMIISFTVALSLLYFRNLAILLLAFIPFYWMLNWITNQINRRYQRKVMEQAADLDTKIVESLHGASTVKRLGLEGYVVAKTESSFFRFAGTAYRTGLYNLYAVTSTDFLNRLLIIVVLWEGCRLVMQQQLSIGELLSFYSLIGYVTGPAASLISSGKNIQDALIAADRLFEITEQEIDSTPEQIKIELTRENLADIQFTAVDFWYGTRSPVLKNISLCFPRGMITAVVGESGSGKSTISNLLQNLYPIREGQITIGSIPLQYFSENSLRTLIGVVPQQVDLFSGSIAENIAIGDMNPDFSRIIQCCRQAGASSFIDELPGGYYSNIGERGIGLSGGQQQKIAIARALYRQPEVLILDEATSHLDPQSEDYILTMVHHLKAAGKTVIIIAHRLSIILAADTIHVLRKGKIEISGKHDFLLRESEYYASLWPVHLPYG